MKVVEEFREDGVIGICWWQYISVKEGVKIGVFNICVLLLIGVCDFVFFEFFGSFCFLYFFIGVFFVVWIGMGIFDLV